MIPPPKKKLFMTLTPEKGGAHYFNKKISKTTFSKSLNSILQLFRSHSMINFFLKKEKEEQYNIHLWLLQLDGFEKK